MTRLEALELLDEARRALGAKARGPRSSWPKRKGDWDAKPRAPMVGLLTGEQAALISVLKVAEGLGYPEPQTRRALHWAPHPKHVLALDVVLLQAPDSSRPVIEALLGALTDE